jgi:hypothetical protein
MSDRDDALVRKGKRHPAENILGQADMSITAAKERIESLVQAGYTRENLSELISRYAELCALLSRSTMAVGEARLATRAEAEAIDEARCFIQFLRTVSSMALRDHRVEGLKPHMLQPERPLGRCSGKIVTHLESIRSTVAKLDEVLKPYFQGGKASERLAEVSSKLAKINANQEVRRQSLPEETRRLQLAKGRLIEAIEDLNRIAQFAFVDRTVRATFDKRILMRGRKTRGKKEAEGEGEMVGEETGS